MIQHSRGSVRIAFAFACALAIGMAACKGDTGPQGPAGPPGASSSTDGGTSAQVASPNRLYAKLTAASVPNGGGAGGAPTVTYRLFKDAAYTQDAGTCAGGTAGYGQFIPNVTIAKQVDDPFNPGLKAWQSYINRLEGSVKIGAVEGSRGTIAGTVKDNGDGSCTYTFKNDLSQTAAAGSSAAVTEKYDPSAVTRIGMQNNPTTVDATNPAFDGWIDFTPSSGQVSTDNTRAIVATQSCNQCHHDLAHHGGKRLSTEYCVTCHNQGLQDPCVSTNTGSGCSTASQNSTLLDFGVMVHKIHQGGDLPSVTGTNLDGTKLTGATPGKIIINGTDYTFVGFPQDTSNCTVCHGATAGTGNDYWKTQASIEACGACHDRTDFAASAPGTSGGTPPKAGFAPHPAGTVQDGQCTTCHGAGKQIDTTKVHNIGIPTTAQEKANYKVVSVTNSAPNATPTVTISVTNPAANGAAMDLTADPLWINTTSGSSRLALVFGWTVKPGEDWDNSGSGYAAGQPVTIDVLASAKAGASATPTKAANGSWTVPTTKNADGSYTLTAPIPIPASAVGSGVALLEGHPGDASGNRFPVTNATTFFPVTDAKATARRQVVDIKKCDQCHGKLSAHGSNRTDNIDACVICHNPQATDISQRPATGTPIDGKTEQSIQFGAMIHGLHAGATAPFTFGLVVYGFGGNANDFRDVQFPEGNSVGRCVMCHADSNPYPSVETGIVNGVTITTGGKTVTDQGTFLRTTKGAGICSSCHQASQPAAHMAQNGAAGVATIGTTTINGAGLTQAQIDTPTGGLGAETCTICHGRNALADPAQFHGQ